MKLNAFIDHTLLGTRASEKDFETLLKEASLFSFYSVCVPPHKVEYAKENLNKTLVKVVSVASFPLGYSTLETKKFEIDHLYKIGCDEVDVVLNLNNIKQGRWDTVESEFELFSEISENQTLKVILETGSLTPEEIKKCCELVNKHPVSFVKTSTGFASKGADLEDVKLLRYHLPDGVKIKASGGIKTYDQALAFIQVGASRIGCSASVKIVSSKKEDA